MLRTEKKVTAWGGLGCKHVTQSEPQGMFGGRRGARAHQGTCPKPIPASVSPVSYHRAIPGPYRTASSQRAPPASHAQRDPAGAPEDMAGVLRRRGKCHGGHGLVRTSHATYRPLQRRGQPGELPTGLSQRGPDGERLRTPLELVGSSLPSDGRRSPSDILLRAYLEREKRSDVLLEGPAKTHRRHWSFIESQPAADPCAVRVVTETACVVC